MAKTPRQRVEFLLTIHSGHCFITKECTDFANLEEAAREMEREGLVTVAPRYCPLFGINVKRNGYMPSHAKPDEYEAPAH